MNEIINEIIYLNPWWSNKESINSDFQIKKIEKSGLNYRASIFSQSDCIKNNIYTLRGPRQVGKTSELKLLVKELIENGRNPKTIAWTVADTIRRIDLLEKHIREIANYLVKNIETDSNYILIVDEITSVPAWQKVIKKLRDDGTLENFCLILTGSSAYDLKQGIETMAGRRGIGKNLDRVLLPMSYTSFKNQVKNTTKNSLELFLKLGGYPFRLSNYLKSGKEELYDFTQDLNIIEEAYWYEINRRGLDKNIALEVLGRLSQIGTTAVSYNAVAKTLNSTKDTIKNHLDALGECFMLVSYGSFDISKKRLAPRKDRKFLWLDPVFKNFAEYLNVGQTLSEAYISEAIVGAELLRKHEMDLHFGLNNLRNVFTWKNDKQREVDFLVYNLINKEAIPYEVKYQENISEWDFKTMQKSFNKGFLITKNFDNCNEKFRAKSLEDFLT